MTDVPEGFMVRVRGERPGFIDHNLKLIGEGGGKFIALFRWRDEGDLWVAYFWPAGVDDPEWRNYESLQRDKKNAAEARRAARAKG